jgi:hypothetical protein
MALALCASTLTIVQAQQRPAAPEPTPVLTADDYAQIEQLYARYGPGVDQGEDDGYWWANMFTPDGLHINASNRLEYVRGRDALAAFVGGLAAPWSSIRNMSRSKTRRASATTPPT